MGLGHSALETAIMYPFYVNPQEKEIELDADDIKGMQSIYGQFQIFHKILLFKYFFINYYHCHKLMSYESFTN